MYILSFFGFVGFMFLSFLLSCAYPAGERGKKQAIPFMIGALICLVCFIYINIRVLQEPLYEYTIKAHYVDGYSRTIKYEGREFSKPEIQMSRGGYYLRYDGNIEYGVVRFELINKKLIDNQ